MSRNKGKAGELQWAKRLTAAGFDAHRGVQYQGGKDSPDVVCPCLPGIHWEVKRTERFSLYDALQQAEADAASGQTPIVAHRRNNHDWVVCLYANDLLDILRDSGMVEAQGETDGR